MNSREEPIKVITAEPSLATSIRQGEFQMINLVASEWFSVKPNPVKRCTEVWSSRVEAAVPGIPPFCW